MFSMVDPNDPLRSVDLFVDEPVPFEELFERADSVELTRIVIRVASTSDLIRLRRMAARPQDDADITALEAILEDREG